MVLGKANCEKNNMFIFLERRNQEAIQPEWKQHSQDLEKEKKKEMAFCF